MLTLLSSGRAGAHLIQCCVWLHLPWAQPSAQSRYLLADITQTKPARGQRAQFWPAYLGLSCALPARSSDAKSKMETQRAPKDHLERARSPFETDGRLCRRRVVVDVDVVVVVVVVLMLSEAGKRQSRITSHVDIGENKSHCCSSRVLLSAVDSGGRDGPTE